VSAKLKKKGVKARRKKAQKSKSVKRRRKAQICAFSSLPHWNLLPMTKAARQGIKQGS
jgi:hypothetical protein